MPYRPIFSHHFINRQYKWEVLISSNYHTIENGFKQIKDKLRPIVERFDVTVIAWQEDFEEFDDLSHSLTEDYPKDEEARSCLGNLKTNRDKEIRIQFADKEHCIHPAKEYKKMLLTIWKALQELNIPMLYYGIPQHHILLGPGNLPLPFFIACIQNQANGSFEPAEENHPLMKLRLTKHDLVDVGIYFNVLENIEQNRRQHKACVNQTISELNPQLAYYIKSSISYSDLLFREDLLNLFKRRFNEYQQSIATLQTDNERSTYTIEFYRNTKSHETILRFLGGYPLQYDSGKIHPLITALLQFTDFQNEGEIEKTVKKLREDYPHNTVNALMDTIIKQSEDLHFAHYFSWLSEENLRELGRVSPGMMQITYNTIKSLNREQQINEQYKALYRQKGSYSHYDLSTPKKTMAVLDVNSTLIIGITNTNINLNHHLIAALAEHGLDEVFLCADMTFDRKAVLERMALIHVLKLNGITVLDVATSADFFWDNEDDTLKEVSNRFKTVADDLPSLIKIKEVIDRKILLLADSRVGQAFKQARKLYNKDFNRYLSFQSMNHLDPILGVLAYIQKTPLISLKKENLLKKSEHCRKLAVFWCKMQHDNSHKPSFEVLMRQHSNSNSIIYLSSKANTIAAINRCKHRLIGQKLITTKQVTSQDTQENYNQLIDEHESQREFITPIFKLDTAYSSFCDKNLNKNKARGKAFKDALGILCSHLRHDIREQILNNSSLEIILNSPAQHIIDSTILMLEQLDDLMSSSLPAAERQLKVKDIMTCYTRCTHSTKCEKFFKFIGLVIGAAIGFCLGGLVGAEIGIASGAWTGVGAAFTGAAGAVSGAFVGVVDGAGLGLFGGAALGGLMSGALVQWGLFSQSELEKQINEDIVKLMACANGLVV